ncbi:hydroxymethylbilane synthase [Yoonia sp. 2307UL14-13]|uniref:hydroxymethylbilane synthase n=1 Tax=Yoonia sp. 2307UL14-13 TaxID=3126506 RepID=UPI003095BE75
MTTEMPSPDNPFQIGTRGSPLALAQAHETRDRLMAAFDLPAAAFAIRVIKVTGDQILDKPLREIDGKGLFTREIEEALLDGSIDIAVHSTKDMPVQQPDGLVLDTFLPREDVRDAFVSLKYKGLADLPDGAVVGTSSTRRRAQLAARFPNLQVVEFRGNVQTRLKKLEDGVADATFLATAGLRRLRMSDVPYHPISPEDMLPAIAQGAIGIERRTGDDRAGEMLAAIHDGPTGHRLAAERALLAGLDGSCETPIGGLAEIDGDALRLRGEILRHDGSAVFTDDVGGAVADGPQMGRAMAARLLERAGPGFF